MAYRRRWRPTAPWEPQNSTGTLLPPRRDVYISCYLDRLLDGREAGRRLGRLPAPCLRTAGTEGPSLPHPTSLEPARALPQAVDDRNYRFEATFVFYLSWNDSTVGVR